MFNRKEKGEVMIMKVMMMMMMMMMNNFLGGIFEQKIN